MKDHLKIILLAVAVAVLGLTAIAFIVLYSLEIQKTEVWQAKISPCLTTDNQETCGPGIQKIIFECPKGNCGKKPDDFQQACISNKTCEWKTEIVE